MRQRVGFPALGGALMLVVCSVILAWRGLVRAVRSK